MNMQAIRCNAATYQCSFVWEQVVDLIVVILGAMTIDFIILIEALDFTIANLIEWYAGVVAYKVSGWANDCIILIITVQTQN